MIRTGQTYGLGSLGCGCDAPSPGTASARYRRTGAIIEGCFGRGTGAVSDSHTDTKRDLISAGVAFGSLLVYPKVAPKKWPKPKNLWQSLGVVVGVYFASSWAFNKIEGV